MKYNFLFLIPFIFSLSACNTIDKENGTASSEGAKTETISSTKLLRHVVLFNFNESATEEIVEKIEQTFADLPGKIPAIHAFEWGTNNSPEGLDKGLSHCFLVTFLKEEDRAAYLPHPAHKAFVKLVGPYVKDVTVVDYWTE